jgi:hypothetical protein
MVILLYDEKLVYSAYIINPPPAGHTNGGAYTERNEENETLCIYEVQAR